MNEEKRGPVPPELWQCWGCGHERYNHATLAKDSDVIPMKRSQCLVYGCTCEAFHPERDATRAAAGLGVTTEPQPELPR
jgi:hypothetical protein